jgi:hypothetical protein
MALPFLDDEIKDADGKTDLEIAIHQLKYELGSIVDGTSGSGPPAVGTEVPGGGVVTGSTANTITIAFPDGSVPAYVEIPGVETTIVHEFAVVGPTNGGGSPGIGFYDISGGPTVGLTVRGGGTVTAVDAHTVTIAFPDGPPSGPSGRAALGGDDDRPGARRHD